MADRIDAYLSERADLSGRPLMCEDTEGVDQAVVIPVLAEGGYLPATLESLEQCDAQERARTLVVCVVNNHPEPSATPAQIKDNQCTLAMLDVRRVSGGLRLACVDASSPGREIPNDSGVGMARKLGLDHALAVLARNGARRGRLFSLDADTLVEPAYLGAVRNHFEQHATWAAVLDYAHRLDDDPETARAAVSWSSSSRWA